MPRKPKREKQVVTILVNGSPIRVIFHPPTEKYKSWCVYWNGLPTKKSTGQRDLPEAIKVAERMLCTGGEQPRLLDIVLSEDEFDRIQVEHLLGKKQDAEDRRRAEKTLTTFRQALSAFKSIAGMDPICFAGPITQATADVCAAFQRKALTLPKNWRQQYPKAKKQVACVSPNTVLKWTRALQAAFERANRGAGRKCVRGVVDPAKLLTGNPWSQFDWIEGVERPIRQFDSDELLSFLDHLEHEWPGVAVAAALTKTFLWSACRLEEVVTLRWDALQATGNEVHFDITGKRGVRRWFRIPEGLYRELLTLRTDSPFVFGAYNEELRRFHEERGRPHNAKNVGSAFRPRCLGDWLYDRLADWSAKSDKGHAHPHVFRKTALQQAWVGDEETDQQVAQDAGVGTKVMMTHYVRALREKSNRTFRRILAALPVEVARRYGHAEVCSPVEELERRLRAAIDAKDWPEVARWSQELAGRRHSPTGS